MLLKCKKCSMNNECICIPDADECLLGGYPWGDGFLIGINPSKCYEKPNRCSILIQFPITSKREENRLYKLLNILIDDKQKQTKEWKRNARELWSGDYAKFGNIA